MSTGYGQTANIRPKIMLKARPTPAQLADRLKAPWADGLEFYLDCQDILTDGWLPGLLAELQRHATPDGFAYVVEGPLRSLDNTFFDLSKDTEANRETLRRVLDFGAAIGAQAAVIHAIAPEYDANPYNDSLREITLHRSLSLLTFYRDLCQGKGIIPTIENIPPVAQMRESRFMHSIIGMEPTDMVELSQQVHGIKITLDISHAQLYLNAVNANNENVPAEWRHLIDHIQRRAQVRKLDDYIAVLAPHLVEAHIANASGLYGEGQRYGEGDIAMDETISRLSSLVRFLVTETLEPDPNVATYMREAQTKMRQTLNRKQALYGEGH